MQNKKIHLFFLLSLLWILPSFAQTTTFNFYRYNEQNKLKSELTKWIAQDTLGVYYIATDNGLFTLMNDEFEKVEMPKGRSLYFKKTYLLKNGDLLAISDDAVYRVKSNLEYHKAHLLFDAKQKDMLYLKSIYEDKNRQLWLGNDDDIFRIINGTVQHFKMPKKNHAESYSRSYQFLEVKNHFLAISEKGYFYKYNPKRNRFDEIYNSNSKVYAHYYLRDNSFLLGTSKGLVQIKLAANGTIAKYHIVNKNIVASCFTSLSANHLLVGTWFTGLWEYYIPKNKFIHIKWSENRTINSLFKEDDTHYWAATNSGLIFFQKKLFRNVVFDNKKSKYINALHYNDGKLRFAVDNLIYQVENGLLEAKQICNVSGFISDFRCFGDTIIVGTRKGNIYQYKGSRLLKKMKLKGKPIIDMEKAGKDKYWLVGDEELFLVDFKRKKIKSYKNQFSSGVANIYQYKNEVYAGGRGSGDYLYRYSKSYDKFVNISVDIEELNTDYSFLVLDMKSVDDVMYLATSSGLIKYNINTEKAYRDDVFDGQINGIAISPTKGVFLTTSEGVIRKKGDEITTFKLSHGLLSKIFTIRTIAATADSLLFIGSSNGVSVFKTGCEKIKSLQPLVFIANQNGKYLENNSCLNLDSNDVLLLDINTIRNRQEDILVEYCLRPKEAADCYEWKKVGAKNELIISKLLPDDYVLSIRVKQNGNYSWSDTLQYELQVDEVWYLAWYTILIEVLMIVSLLYLAVLYARNKEKVQRKKLEQLVEERTKELKMVNDSLDQSDKAKTKFLSIIAHDLRNAFQAIRSFANLLREESDLSEEDKKEMIENIYKGADGTLLLLENLYEWSQMQKGDLIVTKSKFNISELLQKNISLYKSMARLKSVKIKSSLADCEVFADKKMIDSIVRNLLSNAIKYSKQDGDVMLILLEKDNVVQIEVRDYGVGLTPEQINRLFNIDKVQSTKGTQNEEGTGFGLLIVKEFVDKHHGKIWVESVENKQTSFFFTIPR